LAYSSKTKLSLAIWRIFEKVQFEVDGIELIDENWIKANFTAATDERAVKQSKCFEVSDNLVDRLTCDNL